MFYTKCWTCGCDIPGTDSAPPYCEQCKRENIENLRSLSEQKRKINVELMADKAMNMIAKDRYREADFMKYRRSIEAVINAARKTPEIFDSSEEMAAAIALHQQGKRFRMQTKVGSRKVDICLLDEHIFLEIDGSRHNGREYQDTIRDVEILKTAGVCWEIVHLAAKDVSDSPSRVYAKAFSIANQKQEYKRKHGYTIEPEIERVLASKEAFKRKIRGNRWL